MGSKSGEPDGEGVAGKTRRAEGRVDLEKVRTRWSSQGQGWQGEAVVLYVTSSHNRYSLNQRAGKER
jgi:hypothetical protein